MQTRPSGADQARICLWTAEVQPGTIATVFGWLASNQCRGVAQRCLDYVLACWTALRQHISNMPYHCLLKRQPLSVQYHQRPLTLPNLITKVDVGELAN